MSKKKSTKRAIRCVSPDVIRVSRPFLSKPIEIGSNGVVVVDVEVADLLVAEGSFVNHSSLSQDEAENE